MIIEKRDLLCATQSQELQPIVLVGYGKMGRMLEETVPGDWAAITDRIDNKERLLACDLHGKIAIDFSTPSAFLDNYQRLADHCAGVVVGTTGWQAQHAEVVEYFAAHGTPMVYANNFSLGVNIFLRLVAQASCWTAKLLQSQPYLLEMHHCTKLDRPSGTAVQLQKIIQQDYPEQTLEVASLRVAEIKGVHQVGFESAIERLTLKHEAFDRSGFAVGAWYAAQQLMKGQIKGAVTFDWLLSQIWQE